MLSVSDSYSEHVPTLTPGEISRRFCSWPSSESSESIIKLFHQTFVSLPLHCIIKRFHQTFVSSPLHWSTHREISQSYFHLQMVITSGTLQAHHVYSTLKLLRNDRFHVISTWNTRGVFVGYWLIRSTASIVTLFRLFLLPFFSAQFRKSWENLFNLQCIINVIKIVIKKCNKNFNGRILRKGS